MKKSKIILFASLLFLTLNSCEKSVGYPESKYAEEASATESVMLDETSENESGIPLSSTAATHQDPNHKFIRTADLSMEVENVYKSTTCIEKKLAEIGGFVTQSNLDSHIISKELFPVDADSAKEIKKYTVRNIMTIRVPQMELGDFLTSLGDDMKFLNFRNISAEDVSLNFVLSELEKERLDKTSGKLDKITDESGKIADKQTIINDVDDKQSEINYKKVSTLKMKDDVAYSTVSLLLTEKEKVAETTVINLKNYNDKYRPDFWYRAGNSIKDGFYFFQSICIALLYIWPVWLLLAAVFFGLKWFNKKAHAS